MNLNQMASLNNPASILRIAKLIQSGVDSAGLSNTSSAKKISTESLTERFDQIVTDTRLKDTARILFSDGHYARAVEEGLKCLNNSVKEKSGLSGLDGDSLMRAAFSPNNPVLRLNRLKSQSEKDEQRGYMELYAGAIGGVRNPRAHEHLLEDTPEDALELLGITNHLMRKLEKSTKVRRKRTQRNKQTTSP